MSERIFRLLLGATLLIIMFFEWNDLLYVYIGIITFEGLTNWRIPSMISKLRQSPAYLEIATDALRTGKYNFEAERAFRLVISILLLVSCFVFPRTLWFFPWFVGFALFMAGITGICPISISFKKLGFR
ncbi:MAG: DUF2892 domain-containing protein [Nitrospirae bacterium]|nr:DUF2892 domain-containing protein [Nitrospirota bacterium]